MNPSQLTLSNESDTRQLIIHVKPVPAFAKSITFILGILFFLLPIVIITIIIATGNRFHPGFLFMTGAFWLTANFFRRLYLWNTYGREVITFNSEALNYFCDYRYFQNRKQTLIGPFEYLF